MRISALLPLAALLLGSCSGASGETPQKQLSSYATHSWSLVSAYERAHKEKNVEHALALVHLGSVDVNTRDVLIKNLNEDFKKELVSAKIVPIEGHEPLEIVVNDRRMVPNLKVDKRLRLEFRCRLGAWCRTPVSGFGQVPWARRGTRRSVRRPSRCQFFAGAIRTGGIKGEVGQASTDPDSAHE